MSSKNTSSVQNLAERTHNKSGNLTLISSALLITMGIFAFFDCYYTYGNLAMVHNSVYANVNSAWHIFTIVGCVLDILMGVSAVITGMMGIFWHGKEKRRTRCMMAGMISLIMGILIVGTGIGYKLYHMISQEVFVQNVPYLVTSTLRQLVVWCVIPGAYLLGVKVEGVR